MKYMNYVALGFGTGLFFAMLVTSASLYWKTPSHYRSLVNECQKDLPRTEHCILVAVPEKEVDGD